MSWQGPKQSALFQVLEKTWPAHSTSKSGPFLIREGRGGGKRVSAASLRATTFTQAEIKTAIKAMAALEQDPLFMVRSGEEALDSALEAESFRIVDPVSVMVAKTEMIVPAEFAMIQIAEEPTVEQAAIWRAGGIGPSRLAVMQRVEGPRVFMSLDDNAVGFCATHNNIAMVHALEVRKNARKQGLGKRLMGAMALWALDQPAESIALMVTKDNAPAIALYEGMGFVKAADYHYRIAA